VTTLACVWILSTSLAPAIYALGPLRIRPEDPITLLMAAIAVWRWRDPLVRHSWSGPPTVLATAVYGLIVVAITALFFSVLGGRVSDEGTFGHDPGLELGKELVRFVQYLLVAIGFGAVPHTAWAPMRRTLACACIALVAIQLLQYANVLGVNEVILRFYGLGSNEHHLDWAQDWAKEDGKWRSGSLMINPNVFASFLQFPFTLFSLLALESVGGARRSSFGWRWARIALSPRAVSSFTALMCAMGLVLTQSRASLAAAIAAVLAGAAVIIVNGRIGVRGVSAAVLGATAAAVLLAGVFGASLGRLGGEQLLLGLTEGSLSEKVELTLPVLQSLTGPHVLFGLGPANATVLDNEIGYVLAWYGAIGFLIYAGLYAALYATARARAHNIYIAASIGGTLTGYFIGAVSNGYLFNVRIFPLFVAMLTVACAAPVQDAVRSVGMARRSDAPNVRQPVSQFAT
jgi:hypothetical protein